MPFISFAKIIAAKIVVLSIEVTFQKFNLSFARAWSHYF